MNMNKVPCYICGSDKSEFIKESNHCQLFRCLDCDLIWVDGIDEQLVHAFYDEAYYHSESNIGYQDYLSQSDNHTRNAKSIIKTVSKTYDLQGKRVLDVGCAYGFLVNELNRITDAYGIEISSASYEYAKNTLKLNVLNQALDGESFEQEFFDVVFLIGTIEHLVDPRQALKNIHRVLKPGGLLVVTTIDTKGPIPLYSLKPPEHLFYFSNQNLRQLYAQVGFEAKFHKMYFVTYDFIDLTHRVAKFLSWKFLDGLMQFLMNKAPRIPVKIPTNEMILLATKK